MKKTRIALLVLSILFWLIVGVAMIFILPVFAAMFDDFDARLPAMTRACIRLSSVAKASPLIFTATFYGLLAAVSALVAYKNRKIYSILFFASGALAVLALVCALSLPIFQLGSASGGLK